MAAPIQPQLAVVVSVVIKEDWINDFLKVMESDAMNSRDKSVDPGCLRFDLLKSREVPNKFFFYEAFTDDSGMAAHKETAHYKGWAEFKASGGVESQDVMKLEAASISGGWAFQANAALSARMASAVFVTVDIKEDRVADFLVAMQADVSGSRDASLDRGCLRFDLLRFKDSPNRFVFYEAYLDDAAAAAHKTTAHYKAWADFKASGGVEKQEVLKAESASIPGSWAFQAAVTKAGASEIPLVGFGTYKVGAVPASASAAGAGAVAPPGGPDVCSAIIGAALGTGYALLDCAQFYMNESWVGSAIEAAGVPRNSLYITSKVWNDIIYAGPDAVKAQVDKALADLKCGYIDMMMVHWPVPGKHVEAYRALLECKAAGKIKEVGISNYTIEDFEELRAAGVFSSEKDKPACNQIEVNPLLYRKKTLAFFEKEGVHIQSYRGLMQGPKSWELPALQAVCKETGRSPAQVLGRFLVQQGISHVPKASVAERMAENADLFTFDLSKDQVAKLSNLTTPEALETFKNLYVKCIWRDTERAGDPWTSERTLD